MNSFTRAEARRLVLHLQGLTRPHHRAFGPEDTVAEAIDRLGFVQVDAIPQIERAHHMILHARGQSYRPCDLDRLHCAGALFEAWTHDASYVPSRLWPMWKHRFRRSRERLRGKFLRWQGSGCLDRCDGLLARIRERGPLRASDLDGHGRTGEMWSWSHDKAALEYLWRTGELAITARENFRKVYDLPERAIPSEYFEAEISEEAFIDASCRMALNGLGWATPTTIARYLDHVTIAEARGWLARQGTDTTTQVRIDRREFSARADVGSLLNAMPEPPSRIRVLSPFDPVVRDRERLGWLWGFDYRIEIYVPAAKRRWGYYVHPLLEGSRMIGRIDARANRAQGTLDVRRFWLEPGVRWTGGRRERLEAELRRQCRLAGVGRIAWLETKPASLPV